jgi:hypothetical protein
MLGDAELMAVGGGGHGRQGDAMNFEHDQQEAYYYSDASRVNLNTNNVGQAQQNRGLSSSHRPVVAANMR